MSSPSTEPDPPGLTAHQGDAELPDGADAMAWQLVDEVMAGSDVKLTGAEVRVLLVIAARCRDLNTRTVQLTRGDLADAAHLTEEGVRKALRGLRSKRLDPRVPIPGAYGSDGRPVYAWPGRPTTYRLPRLVDEPDTKPDPDEPGDGAAAPGKGGTPGPGKGGRTGPAKPGTGGRAKPGRTGPPKPGTKGRPFDHEACAACRYCDEHGHTLGIDGLPVDPVLYCSRCACRG